VIAPGVECRLLRGPLGCIAHPDASGFEREVVGPGTRATYFGPHSLKGWHLLIVAGHPAHGSYRPGETVKAQGRPLFVPVTEEQFEVIG
jgi:hypothetical protein